MLFILIFFIILLVASMTAAILMISVFFGLVRARGVPFISSSKKIFTEILKAAELKPGDQIYDLGCGKAHFLIQAARDYGVSGVGYEISLWPYLWAKFNVWRSGTRVKIYFKNFFKVDLSSADVVFCYLFPEVMAKLEPKFKKELKPGSRVISNSFILPNKEPARIIATNKKNPNLEKILIYQF